MYEFESETCPGYRVARPITLHIYFDLRTYALGRLVKRLLGERAPERQWPHLRRTSLPFTTQPIRALFLSLVVPHSQSHVRNFILSVDNSQPSVQIHITLIHVCTSHGVACYHRGVRSMMKWKKPMCILLSKVKHGGRKNLTISINGFRFRFLLYAHPRKWL